MKSIEIAEYIVDLPSMLCIDGHPQEVTNLQKLPEHSIDGREVYYVGINGNNPSTKEYIFFFKLSPRHDIPLVNPKSGIETRCFITSGSGAAIFVNDSGKWTHERLGRGNVIGFPTDGDPSGFMSGDGGITAGFFVTSSIALDKLRLTPSSAGYDAEVRTYRSSSMYSITATATY